MRQVKIAKTTNLGTTLYTPKRCGLKYVSNGILSFNSLMRFFVIVSLFSDMVI